MKKEKQIILDCDAIIVNYNRPKETTLTIKSLKANNKLNSIILIDNGSKDLDYLNDLQVDKIIKNKTNIGQAAATNQGHALAYSKYILTMHNDVVVNDCNWIGRAIDFLEQNKKAGLISLAGWKGTAHNSIITSLLDILKSYPHAIKYFDSEGEFIKVCRVDSVVSIYRNLGINADIHFGAVGTSFFLEYLHLGYEIYVMKVKNGIHLKGSSMDYKSKEFLRQRKLVGKIHEDKLKEYKLFGYKENK